MHNMNYTSTTRWKSVGPVTINYLNKHMMGNSNPMKKVKKERERERNRSK